MGWRKQKMPLTIELCISFETGISPSNEKEFRISNI